MASSIDEHDGEDASQKKEKSRKPGNTAFRQQRLKAWQPILTPKTVLPLFFIVGIIFAPIGGLLLYASAKVQEIVIDYTDCDQASGNFEPIGHGKWSANFNSPVGRQDKPRWRVLKNQKTKDPKMLKTNPKFNETVCQIEFSLPNDLDPPILFYYRLTNFYQNHRRYVQSLNDNQLKGQALSKGKLGSCDPLSGKNDTPYYPCGLIANSLFNDTFETPFAVLNPPGGVDNTYVMTNKNIAWDSDKARFGKTKYTSDQVLPPPNWAERYENGRYTNDTMPNIHEDEEFQAWMRTAGLPIFSKLALRNDTGRMSQATYRINIDYRFPVREYSGTKSIVISTRTVMGGKNPFLGIAYVVVGGLAVLLGALFTARHLIKPRKLGDHTYLSWNNEESTAQATGRDI